MQEIYYVAVSGEVWLDIHNNLYKSRHLNNQIDTKSTQFVPYENIQLEIGKI